MTHPVEQSVQDFLGDQLAPTEGFHPERVLVKVEAPESLVALGDEERLAVILGQLLSNVEKFAPEGTVVRVKVARTSGGAEILVSDQDPGIPHAQWETVFERFVQLDGGSRRRHGGVGLGLFIARKLAQSMGGVLEVAESTEAGTTFRLKLDVSETITPPIRASGEAVRAG